MAYTPPARRVTVDVEPAAVRDLLDQPPRASVAFVDAGAAAVLPARAHFDGDRRLFAVVADAAALDRREVVLLIDDGPYWFQLRGVSVRGIANRVDAPTGAEATPLASHGPMDRTAEPRGARCRVRPEESEGAAPS